MEKIRGQEQELRQLVHQNKHEAGLRALFDLAQIKREKALQQWRGASGTDLVKYQSEYNSMQGIMDFILKAPQEFTARPSAAVRPDAAE
jgi:hypothetical protein